MNAPKKIKILHVIDHLGLGGVQDILVGLARHMDRGRFDLELAVLWRSNAFYGDSFRQLRVPVHFLSDPQFPLPNIPKLAALIKQERYDVVHTHLFFGYLAGLLAAGMSRTKPVLVESIEHLAEQVPFFVFPIYRLFSPCVRMFFAMNRFMERDILKTGAKRSKVLLMPFGCDASSLLKKFDRAGIRRDLSLNAEDKVLFRASRLAPDKKHALVLRAMPKLLQAVPQAKFLIAGDGPLRTELQTMCHELGIEKAVRFLGARKDMGELNAAGDVGTELGFGISCLEHMMSGLPVISFDECEPREIIEDGENGFVVPAGDIDAFADKVAFLFKNDRERERMGKKAKEAALSRYTHTAMAKRYEKAYAELLHV